MKIVDLTLEITPDMITFPGYPVPTFIKWSKFETQGYVSEVVFLSTHTGTHMDAPFHFNPNGPTIDQVEVYRYICNNTILIKIQKNSNQMITSHDIICNSKYEIKEKDTVVFSTGWEKQIKEKDNYMKNNPGLSKDAAEYLVEKKVNAVAIDCPSIDIGTDSGFIAHKMLLSNQILVIENLCNLCRFNNEKFTLLITPLKLVGASGSPIRAIGIEEWKRIISHEHFWKLPRWLVHIIQKQKDKHMHNVRLARCEPKEERKTAKFTEEDLVTIH